MSKNSKPTLTPAPQTEAWPKVTKGSVKTYEAPEGYRVFIAGMNHGWGVAEDGSTAIQNAYGPRYFLAWLVRGELRVNPLTGAPSVSGPDADLLRLGACLKKADYAQICC